MAEMWPKIWTDALGVSDIFLDFQEKLGVLAKADRPLLIIGERGTGKELAVQRLHYMSPRWENPLVTVLCPAISPTLLESELFGHEAGAFTGARAMHRGYFERAEGGTVFLDEVADMPLPLQDKLLRVIEYGTFERVGGNAPIRADVRILAATNRNLPKLAQEGAFRDDLLDRLAFDVLHVPPLRKRAEDRLLLARHFAGRMALELDKLELDKEDVPQFGPEAMAQIENYDWPGNIRELKNAVERAVVHMQGGTIERLELNPFRADWEQGGSWGADQSVRQTDKPQAELCKEQQEQPVLQDKETLLSENTTLPFATKSLPVGFSLSDAVADMEKRAVNIALAQAQYKQKDAARLLGLSYNQFRNLYRKYSQ